MTTAALGRLTGVRGGAAVGGPKAEEAPAEPILAEVLSTIQKVPIGNVFSCK